MKTATERDLASGVTTVRLVGELNRSTVTTVRRALGKAAAECPAAVIVDLSGLLRTSGTLLSAFAAASHQAWEAWGVPVLFYGADPELGRDLGAFRTYVALYEDVFQTMIAVRAYAPRYLSERLPPVPSSAAGARGLLGEACLMWGLNHLRDNARLVASELAANAIRHAGTEFDVVCSYAGRYLRISVRDGSQAMPRVVEPDGTSGGIVRAGSGRGMPIVAAASTHWGVTRLPAGKNVWALMRAAPGGTSSDPCPR
ncbi:ATP-binding protein [Actinoplanes sp. NPDC049596]|uniref:ATP-binding protein n=1 Tax=unclassified Actinoplanes TaxID=2626549 RepID=UPI003441F87E